MSHIHQKSCADATVQDMIVMSPSEIRVSELGLVSVVLQQSDNSISQSSGLSIIRKGSFSPWWDEQWSWSDGHKTTRSGNYTYLSKKLWGANWSNWLQPPWLGHLTKTLSWKVSTAHHSELTSNNERLYFIN